MSSAAAAPRRFAIPTGVDEREVARELERIDAHVRRDAAEGRTPAYLQPREGAGGPAIPAAPILPPPQSLPASSIHRGSSSNANTVAAAPSSQTAMLFGADDDPVERTNDFSLTSDIFLRLLGVAYFWAFASALCQLQALQGSTGLDPADALLSRVTASVVSGETAASAADIPLLTLLDRFPSLLWPLQRAGVPLDWALHAFCLVGLAAAALQSMGCRMRGFAALALFACYHTLTSCGGQFYSFQWDALLLELGFHAVLLQPHSSRPTTAVGVWLLRVVWFRYNFANGVVKLTAGCPEWLSLRALRVHFWTQPLPTPLAWYDEFIFLVLISIWICRIRAYISTITKCEYGWIVAMPGMRPSCLARCSMHSPMWRSGSRLPFRCWC
jgi:hypothetical protein